MSSHECTERKESRRSSCTWAIIVVAVEKVLRAHKLGVIENYIGHGIGKTMHEDPEVPNYGRPGTGYQLKAGDTICIEPMSSLGKAANRVGPDGWSVILKDGSIGAHVEHTVIVLDDGYEVLTLPDEK